MLAFQPDKQTRQAGKTKAYVPIIVGQTPTTIAGQIAIDNGEDHKCPFMNMNRMTKAARSVVADSR